MKLFALRNNRFVGDYAYGEQVEPMNLGDAPQCPDCGQYIGLMEWLPPLKIKFGRGMKTKKPGDLIFGTFVEFVASGRFKELWDRNGLQGITGWIPVEVVNKGKDKSEYFYPRFKKAEAKPDYKKMTVVWDEEYGPPTCKTCMKAGFEAYEGIHLIQNTIPDDDLFHIRGFSAIIASEKFRAFAAENELVNVELIPAERMKWDPGKVIKHLKVVKD